MTNLTLDKSALPFSEANAVLRQKGKTFYWASQLLSPRHAIRATRLYSLCRYLDDLADETTSATEAITALNDAQLAIIQRSSNHAVLNDGLRLIDECAIDPRVMCQLIDGVSSDLKPVAMADVDELLRYCYRVAGTVGLMMCDVLDVGNKAALPYAVDLGIAMQLTNICRDVQADALVGRRYLPASLVGELPSEALINPELDIQPQLKDALRQLLALANRYYNSGELGLSYLPPGARIGILTAARVYSDIGYQLERCQHQYWLGRVVVNPTRKAALTAKLLFGAAVTPSLWRPTDDHDPSLHSALQPLLIAYA